MNFTPLLISVNGRSLYRKLEYDFTTTDATRAAYLRFNEPITSLYIPSTVTELESSCFEYLNNLREMMFPSTIVKYGEKIAKKK